MHVTAHQTFVDTAGQAAGDGVRYQHCQAQRNAYIYTAYISTYVYMTMFVHTSSLLCNCALFNYTSAYQTFVHASGKLAGDGMRNQHCQAQWYVYIYTAYISTCICVHKNDCTYILTVQLHIVQVYEC
jgi:hypothetical protein